MGFGRQNPSQAETRHMGPVTGARLLRQAEVAPLDLSRSWFELQHGPANLGPRTRLEDNLA